MATNVVKPTFMFRIETFISVVSTLFFVNFISNRYHHAMNEDRLHTLLVCIARALQSEQRQHAVSAGLLPVQWTILSYLRDANRYSNTPQALAEFLSLTKGTVSQSLKLLESHGWISRAADAADRRIVRLGLTETGRAQLGGTASSEWMSAIAQMPRAQHAAAETALAQLLGEWQQTRRGRTFGVCRSCRHFQAGRMEHRCGLTGEVLSEEDSGKICREHEEPVDRTDQPALA